MKIVNFLKNNKNSILGLMLTGIIPVIIFITSTAASGMLPGQKYCFIFSDGMYQMMIFPKAFFRNLFEGGSLEYSFKNGLGMPVSAINAYYSYSPFNVLFYLIEDAEVAGLFVVCSKLMCISMSMYLLLMRIFRTRGIALVFLSVSYALCSFFCFFYIFFLFLDMLYIFPLLVLAIVRFVKSGRWGSLCLIYAYSFIVQFYGAYITGLFSVVIFLAYSWYCFGSKIELWKKKVIQYTACVFLAILLAAPVLLPAAYEIFHFLSKDVADSSAGISPESFLAGFFPGQSQAIRNSIPYMYAGLPVLILSTAFFFNRAINKREKVLAIIPIVFLLICSIIRPFYLLMHAFDAPNGCAYRFSFLMDFCLILIAGRELECINETNIKKNVLWIAGGMWMLFYFIAYLLQKSFTSGNTMSVGGGLIVSGLLVLYVIIMAGSKKRVVRDILVGGVLIAELFVNLLMGQAMVQDEVIDRNSYNIAKLHASESLAEIDDHEKNDPWRFYRVRYLNSITDNISMLYGFNGLGYFCSVENEKTRNFLEKYGYASSYHLLYDYGSTPFMQVILAQKYDIECGFGRGEQSIYRSFKKNDQCLPLAYMVSEDIRDYRTTEKSPFAAQNSLATAMCGHECEIFSHYSGTCYAESDNVEIYQYGDGTEVKLTGDEGSLEFMVPADDNRDVFAYMKKREKSLLEITSPYIYSNIDIGGMLKRSRVNMPHIIPIMSDEDGMCRLTVRMDKSTSSVFDYEALYFAYENEYEIEKVYEELSPGAMYVTSFRDDRIEGKVTVSQDKKLLFTSIPYNEGWTVYVDAERVEPFPVLDDTFLGIMLEEGEHDVLFVYKSKWVTMGIVTGIIGLSIFIATAVRKKREFF